jgi:DNA-binding response OmpR family regulator
MIESTANKNPVALVIEDDDLLCEVATKALQMAEYQVETVKDGITAQNRLAEIAPAIVILDLHLPKVSGMELFHQIRSDDRLAETRVILATADPGNAQELEQEADIVLIKPYSFTQLRDFATRLRPPL